MKIYARVDSGVVKEIILPVRYEVPADSLQDEIDPDLWALMVERAGQEVPIDQRYASDLVVQMVDITSIAPQPLEGWSYDGVKFAAPVPYQPSVDEIKATNTAQRDALIASATVAIAPLQDAVDLGEATDAETASLKVWKKYRVEVNRVDLSLTSPLWPTAPTA